MIVKVRPFRTLLISVLCLVGFFVMAIIVNKHTTLAFDSVIISIIQGLENPVLTLVMEFFTHIGSFIVIASIAVIFGIFMYLTLKFRYELILLPIAIIGARLLNRFLKEMFQRVRPELNRLIEIGGYSFPSGHAMNAMAFYGILAYILWWYVPGRWGRTLLIITSSVFILMIGISRIYLGVHYPSDIIAGYFASGFFITLVIFLFQSFNLLQNHSMG